MGYKINGEVIISNSKDIDNVGIATMDLVDAKVSAKAITEQTEGGVSDVTGADEVLIYDAEGGSLLRVTVDEFITGSGIGTLVSDFDSLNVTNGVATIGNIAMASTESSITLPDSAEIVLGDSADFSMHHDGDHTYLDEAGQGNLKIRTNNFRVTNVAETKPSITAQVTQGVELHYDGNKKFETTNTGAVVSGILSAQNINATGIATIPTIEGDVGITGILTARAFEGDGSTNVIIGRDIGNKTNSRENVSIGCSAGRVNNFSYSTFYGAMAGENSSADYATFFGYKSGRNNTTGTQNVFVGNFAGENNTFGGGNTFIGHFAGGSVVVPGTSRNNTFVGRSCGQSIGAGGTNTAMGYAAASGNQTGAYNACFGSFAGSLNSSGSNNVCVGYAAGYEARDSDYNIYVGSFSGFNLESGNDNTIIGDSGANDLVVGTGNIFVGSLAGAGMTGGSNNVYIGRGHGPSQDVVNQTMSIGYGLTAWITGDSGYNIDIPNNLTASDATFRNLKTAGITTIQDHLEVNDSTGAGSEYNLNVKTSGSSTFGVLGNGAVLLGNNSSAPFIATNDHHATSKKYVDDAIAAASSSGVNEFVATGNIPNGATVVINSDGTVGVVTASSSPTTSGTPVVFESATTDFISATYDSSNGKVVIAYQDQGNSSYGTAIVGTVSGSTISFGAPVVFESANTQEISAIYDSSNQKVVIAYNDGGNSSYGTAIVGTVSGTSISFGSPTVFNSNATFAISATYDSTNNKVVIGYFDDGNGGFGTAIVGTVSGTAISFGTSVVFESDTVGFIHATYDSNSDRVVFVYQDIGNSFHGTAVVGTVSGTSISFGTPVEFNSSATFVASVTYDSTNNKVVIAYQNFDTGFGTALVGTVSGTTISFGSPAVFNSTNTESISATHDSSNGKVVIAYKDGGNSSYGTAVVGTVSGTSISFDTPVVFESDTTISISLTYDSTNNKVVAGYQDQGNSSHGTSVVFSPGSSIQNLTEENYIGIAAEAISDGATGKITTVGGVNSQQTGLTTARKYYVQTDGSLGLTADTPSVVAGTSISATKIIVR